MCRDSFTIVTILDLYKKSLLLLDFYGEKSVANLNFLSSTKVFKQK
jgi:hypothetical protein